MMIIVEWGVARQLLKIATTKHGCSQLTIDKTNSAAISLYKSDGWTSYKDDNQYLYMSKIGELYDYRD